MSAPPMAGVLSLHLVTILMHLMQFLPVKQACVRFYRRLPCLNFLTTPSVNYAVYDVGDDVMMMALCWLVTSCLAVAIVLHCRIQANKFASASCCSVMPCWNCDGCVCHQGANKAIEWSAVWGGHGVHVVACIFLLENYLSSFTMCTPAIGSIMVVNKDRTVPRK